MYFLLLHFEKKCIRLAFFRWTVETRNKRRIATKVISIESRANLENSVRRSVGLWVCRSVCHVQPPNPFSDFDETLAVNNLWKTLTLEALLRSETGSVRYRRFKIFGKN